MVAVNQNRLIGLQNDLFAAQLEANRMEAIQAVLSEDDLEQVEAQLRAYGKAATPVLINLSASKKEIGELARSMLGQLAGEISGEELEKAAVSLMSAAARDFFLVSEHILESEEAIEKRLDLAARASDRAKSALLVLTFKFHAAGYRPSGEFLHEMTGTLWALRQQADFEREILNYAEAEASSARAIEVATWASISEEEVNEARRSEFMEAKFAEASRLSAWQTIDWSRQQFWQLIAVFCQEDLDGEIGGNLDELGEIERDQELLEVCFGYKHTPAEADYLGVEATEFEWADRAR